jgi:hypothetical protein
LFVGTPKDNVQDMARKGRAAFGPGVRHPGAKLTEDNVRAILAEYVWYSDSSTRLAARFGVSRSQIGYIARRKNWRHVP